MLSEGDHSGLQPPTCFYICPIGAVGSPTRKRSNQIFKHIVCEALQPFGYKIRRADELDTSGMITNQIIDGLLTNDLLIADLTDHNPNVFYELAIRHAFGKPFIQLIAEGQELPFDIQNLRTVFLDHTDLDSVAEAKRQLASMIQSVNSGARVDTPLTHTADLQALRQTEGSEARGIIELLGEMSSIKQILQEKGVLRTRAPSPDLAIFRKFIFDLADGGRLSVQDLNTLIDADLTAAHANWIKDKIYPLVAKNEEPPF